MPLPPAPLRILIADDESATVMMTRALLERRGHAVTAAADGAAALALVENQPAFDIVLLDLHMPELDGAATLQAIRALPDPAQAGAVVVMLTASPDRNMDGMLIEAGADAVMAKPLRWDTLEPVLIRCLAEANGMTVEERTAAVCAPAGLSPVDRMLADLPLQRVRQLLDMAMVNLTRHRGDIIAAAACADRDEVSRLAHKIAGVAGTCGCMALHASALALERSAAGLEDAALRDHVAALAPAFDAGIAYLRDATPATARRQPA